MIYFNIETQKSGAKVPLWTLFIKTNVAIATFKNLLKMTVLKEHINKSNRAKGRLNVLSYVSFPSTLIFLPVTNVYVGGYSLIQLQDPQKKFIYT